MNLSLQDFGKVFFCTGARNHDLLAILENHEIEFEYDERMASFKSLGLNKIAKLPSLVCTTSGTAVAECVPAMLEAQYSDVPFILISGDRPKKMHGTGAPQTIDHEGVTRACRGSYLEVTLEEFKKLKIEKALFPLHINVLIDDSLPHKESVIHHEGTEGFGLFLSKSKTPLFLISHEYQSMRPLIEKLKEKKVTFYAETLSGGRELSTIESEKQLIHLLKGGHFDAIVRIGHTPLSKIWRLLEMKHLPVYSFDARGRSGLSYGHVSNYSSKELINNSHFWQALKNFENTELHSPESNLETLLVKFPHSEPSNLRRIQNELRPGDLIYLGNSLVVRFFELIQNRALEVYGSRGVNGIDGQLATAIGLASGTKQRVICILGDITTLYDLSSLREMPQNLKLVIINNRGGRIFEMLKLDKRIVMEHEIDFAEITSGFGLTYSQEIKDFNTVQVLELHPDRLQTEIFLKEWNP